MIPLICIEDALDACRLIINFTENIDRGEFCNDPKTQAAVERKFEIIGFRNVIAHGYDVIEDEIVWEAVTENIPILFKQLNSILAK